MNWEAELEAPREEAARRLKEKLRRYALAYDMRAKGHSTDEISERTGIPKSTVRHLTRGLGRRQ